MISFNVVKIGHKWRYKFENEHNVVSFLQISFFVFLKNLLFLFLHINLEN